MADSTAKPRPSRTVKEGWAMKQGPPPWKNWKKKYLALNDNGLFYFKSAKKTKADLKGSIGLAIMSQILAISDTKRKYCMKIETTTGHNFFFAFEEDKELKGWIDTIEKAKDKNKQGTLTRMKKKQEKGGSAQAKLEDLFTPPPAKEAAPVKEPTPTPTPRDLPQSSSKDVQSPKERRAAAKEKRKLEKEKEREREKEKKEKKKSDKKNKASGSSKKREESESPSSRGKSKHKHSKGKKPETEPEGESDFRTMLVHPNQVDTGEFREYLPEPELPEPRGSFPTKEELSTLPKSKLKEADGVMDIERDAQIRVIKAKYAAQKIEIIDLLVEKEVEAISSKYATERKAILEELKKRGVEAEAK